MCTFYSLDPEIWTPGALPQILEMKINQIDWGWLNFPMIDSLKYESARCAKQWSLMDEIQVNKKKEKHNERQCGLEASFLRRVQSGILILSLPAWY